MFLKNYTHVTYLINYTQVTYLINYSQVTYLSKGTVLGRVLWSANIFPTCNRLSDSKSGFVNLPYPVFGFL